MAQAISPTDFFAAGPSAPIADAAPTSLAPEDFFGAPKQPVNATVLSVSADGIPVFADPAQNTALMQSMADINGRMLEKGAEGASLGLAPYAEAPVVSAVKGVPYSEGLKAARDYTAQTSEKYPAASLGMEAVGSAIPTLATGGLLNPAEGLLGRTAATALTGATVGSASAAGHDLGSGNTSNIGPDALTGAALGGVAGGAPGVVSGLAGRALGAASVAPEAGALASLARDQYGIPINGAQMTGSGAVRYLYSQLKKVPFSGVGHEAGEQQDAFNRAIAQTFGEDSSKISPDVLSNAKSRIGDVFNGVASRTSVPMTPDLMTGLQNVVDDAHLTMSADSAPAIERQAMNIVNTAANNNGNIGGRAYLDLTAKGGPLDTMMQSSDSGMRQSGIRLRSVLDDALQANAAPDDISALTKARSQWRALKTVEPLTLRADTIGGPAPSTGDISPAALRGAVNRSYPQAATAQPGALPLNDLARIGQRFLKEPPDSGTATREMMTHGLGALGGLTTAIMGHEAGIPLAYSLAGVGGAGLGARLIGKALQSGAYANMVLGKQPAVNPLARALLPISGTAPMLPFNGNPPLGQ